MLDINAVKRVVDKRFAKGQTEQQVVTYLNDLKQTAWKDCKEPINAIIDIIVKKLP